MSASLPTKLDIAVLVTVNMSDPAETAGRTQKWLPSFRYGETTLTESPDELGDLAAPERTVMLDERAFARDYADERAELTRTAWPGTAGRATARRPRPGTALPR